MTDPTKVRRSHPRGQSMLEFALALPILLTVIFGLLEVGRAVFMYAAVVNASREAVRYATAYGVNETNVLQYHNCAAIRNEAKRVAFLLPIEDDDIAIVYDSGPDPVADDPEIIDPLAGDANLWDTECAPNEPVDTTIGLSCGDRVVVTVSIDYQPIVPLLVPITAQTFESSSARTYLGVLELTDTAPACN